MDAILFPPEYSDSHMPALTKKFVSRKLQLKAGSPSPPMRAEYFSPFPNPLIGMLLSSVSYLFQANDSAKSME